MSPPRLCEEALLFVLADDLSSEAYLTSFNKLGVGGSNLGMQAIQDVGLGNFYRSFWTYGSQMAGLQRQRTVLGNPYAICSP